MLIVRYEADRDSEELVDCRRLRIRRQSAPALTVSHVNELLLQLGRDALALHVL